MRPSTETIASVLFVLTPLVIILVTIACGVLHSVWTGKAFVHRALRYLLTLTVGNATLVVAACVLPFITLGDIASVLSDMRAVEPVFGWAVTLVFAMHVLMPVAAIVTAIKIWLESEDESSIDGFVYRIPCRWRSRRDVAIRTTTTEGFQVEGMIVMILERTGVRFIYFLFSFTWQSPGVIAEQRWQQAITRPRMVHYTQ